MKISQDAVRIIGSIGDLVELIAVGIISVSEIIHRSGVIHLQPLLFHGLDIAIGIVTKIAYTKIYRAATREGIVPDATVILRKIRFQDPVGIIIVISKSTFQPVSLAFPEGPGYIAIQMGW